MYKYFIVIFLSLLFSCTKKDTTSSSSTNPPSNNSVGITAMSFLINSTSYNANQITADSFALNIPFGPCLQNGIKVNALTLDNGATSDISVLGTFPLQRNASDAKYYGQITVTAQDGLTKKKYILKINNDPIVTTYTGENIFGIGAIDSSMATTDVVISISNLSSDPVTYVDMNFKTKTKSAVNGVLNILKSDLVIVPAYLDPNLLIGKLNLDGYKFTLSNSCGDISLNPSASATCKTSEIRHWKDLQGIRMGFKNDRNGVLIMAGNYIIKNDINMPNPGTDNMPPEGFAPIGYWTTPLSGVGLNGNAKTISNFYINRPLQENVGLFGYVKEQLTVGISDLTINLSTNSTNSITGLQYIGALIGNIQSIIYNGGPSINNVKINGGVITAANINSNSIATGGLIGLALHTAINNCSTNVKVIGSNYSFATGGLVGQFIEQPPSLTLTTATISGCSTSGDVYGHDVGGLVGYCGPNTTISKSFSTGTIFYNYSPVNGSSGLAGGLIGQNSGTIKDSYSKSIININSSTSSPGAFTYCGGLVGNNQAGAIFQSYSANTIKEIGGGKSLYIGGLVGYNSKDAYNAGGNITSCYSNSDIIANSTNSNVGGLIGYQETFYAYFWNCYATGNLTLSSSATNSFIGGILGFSNATPNVNLAVSDHSYYTGNITISGNSSNTFGPIYGNTLAGFSYYSSSSVFPSISFANADSKGSMTLKDRVIDITTATQLSFKNFDFTYGAWKWTNGQWPKLGWQ